MKKYLLNYFVVATLLICGMFVINAQETRVITKIGRNFYKMSDNGKFIVGNYGAGIGAKGYVYSVDRDQFIDLTDGEVDQSMANDVTNDGVVYGQYRFNAAYFEIEWEDGFAVATPLEIPNAKKWDETTVSAVTPDGSFATGNGMKLTPEVGYTGSPMKWNLKTGEVTVMELNHPNVILGKADLLSANGERSTGRVIYDDPAIQKFLVGSWDKNNKFEVVNPELFVPGNYENMDIYGINKDMSKGVGTYNKIIKDEDTGFDNIAPYPYIYDYDTKELKVLDHEYSEFMGISETGRIIGSAYTGGAPNLGTAQIYENGTLYDLNDWLIEFYQCHALSEFAVTGIPYDISVDGRTIIGTSGMGEAFEDYGNVLTAYLIIIGESKTCPKVTDFKGESIGNETISLTWTAPTGYTSEIKGYNVYMNGQKITDKLLTTTSYSEIAISGGEHYYAVEVIYEDGCSSGKTDPVVISIYRKGSCNSPSSLTGWASMGEQIRIEWEYPKFDLTYDTGSIPKFSFAAGALSEDGDEVIYYPFYFGTKWTEKEIADKQLDGLTIEDVSFFVNAKADYEIVIFTNDKEHVVTPGMKFDQGSVELYRQSISEEEMNAGYDSYATFKLTTPIVIDKNKKNYYISIYVKNYDMSELESPAPAAADHGPLTAMWKSDLIAYEFDPMAPVDWMSLKTIYFDVDCNWVLSATVSPKRGDQVSPYILDVPSLYDPMVDSYSIFRDGTEIAKATTNMYSDFTISQDNVDYVYTVKANYKYNCVSESSNEFSCNTKSVNDNFEIDIKLYPNPVENGVLFIDSEYKSITITDLQGRIVLQAGEGSNSVNIKQLQRGTYFVKVSVEAGDLMKKIMVK